jgi:membrane fusion protein, multidrug efflux system
MSEMPRTQSFQQAPEIASEIPAPSPSGVHGKLRRAALVLALLAGTATAAYYGHGYWTTGRYLESTDDAYVKADSTIIAPRVSGYVAEVLVGDNESVQAGRLLARSTTAISGRR